MGCSDSAPKALPEPDNAPTLKKPVTTTEPVIDETPEQKEVSEPAVKDEIKQGIVTTLITGQGGMQKILVMGSD